MACNAWVNPIITSWYLKAGNLLSRIFYKDAVETTGEPLTAEQLVKRAIKELVGDDSYFDPSSDLGSAGIASVGLPIFVGLINSYSEFLDLKVSDVASLSTLGDLVNELDERLKLSAAAAGVGEEVL